jgi:hypothetical protein
MSLFATPYLVSKSKTASYTVLSTDDLVIFTVAAQASVTATLPSSTGLFGGQILASRMGGQGIVYIENAAASVSIVTIAAASGDTLFGTSTVQPGQIVKVVSDGAGTWYAEAPGGLSLGRLFVYQETCPVTSFTDGGSTSGTLVLSHTVPAGAVYAQTLVTGLVGFAGDVSATATLGDGSDVDRYNTGTPNFFTTAAAGVDMGVPSGTKFHSAAIATVTLTVTTNSDFTLCKTNGTGSVRVSMYYYKAI